MFNRVQYFAKPSKSHIDDWTGLKTFYKINLITQTLYLFIKITTK